MIDMDQRKTGSLNSGLKGNIVKDILRKINFKKFSEHFLVEAWEWEEIVSKIIIISSIFEII